MTLLWGDNTPLGFPVLKPGEAFSILAKTNYYLPTKKFYLRRAHFFDLPYTINAEWKCFLFKYYFGV